MYELPEIMQFMRSQEDFQLYYENYNNKPLTGAFIKTFKKMNMRVLFLGSCIDLDIYEGTDEDSINYTSNKPRHKRYSMGSKYMIPFKEQFDEFTIEFNKYISE